MAKLYFKYGAMGSSKTAQALITQYNYEENGEKADVVVLLKKALKNYFYKKTKQAPLMDE